MHAKIAWFTFSVVFVALSVCGTVFVLCRHLLSFSAWHTCTSTCMATQVEPLCTIISACRTYGFCCILLWFLFLLFHLPYVGRPACWCTSLVACIHLYSHYLIKHQTLLLTNVVIYPMLMPIVCCMHVSVILLLFLPAVYDHTHNLWYMQEWLQIVDCLTMFPYNQPPLSECLHAWWGQPLRNPDWYEVSGISVIARWLPNSDNSARLHFFHIRSLSGDAVSHIMGYTGTSSLMDVCIHCWTHLL